MPIARVGDISINFKVEGEGEPLVMIMGFGSGMEGWHYQAPFFAKRFRVVTFDNRGVGKSDKPEGPYTTAMMAEDAVHLMDHLCIERAHVMGASMGGMIAQELAINHPERVKKLVLACTYAQPLLRDTDGARLTGTPAERMGAVIGLAFNKPLYRLVFGNIARLRSIPEGSPLAVGIEGQSSAVATHDTLDRLGAITAPTLVIVGTGDRLIDPKASEIIAGRIPGARLVKIGGGSHTFMMEKSGEFNREVLKFLTEAKQ
jgi:pimeloyl-ACP methyl ester carboxylesterase